MDDNSNPIEKVTGWTFLNEPLYRWVLFFVALAFIGVAWRGVVDFMKAG